MTHQWTTRLDLGGREVALDQPTYFIADVASNHDGELARALDLIWQAKEAGADCAKFQHFLAKDIVSDPGFQALGGQMAHQADWKESVYAVFEKYQTPRGWTDALVEECRKANIDFMTTPYDFAALELTAPVMKAVKIGSGDIGWPQFIQASAQKDLPIFVSTGASAMADVERAVDAALAVNPNVCVMQCNTNYTGERENFRHVNLKVLQAFALKWPGMVLGFSDHTPGHAAVLGAVAFGARAVEKHFTDDNDRQGPDHPFSLNPVTWREMVERTRELEWALGDGVKRVEANERDSVVVQRRSLRFAKDRPVGHVLTAEDLVALRPCPEGAVEPYALEQVVGRTLVSPAKEGDALTWAHVDAYAAAAAGTRAA